MDPPRNDFNGSGIPPHRRQGQDQGTPQQLCGFPFQEVRFLMPIFLISCLFWNIFRKIYTSIPYLNTWISRWWRVSFHMKKWITHENYCSQFGAWCIPLFYSYIVSKPPPCCIRRYWKEQGTTRTARSNPFTSRAWAPQKSHRWTPSRTHESTRRREIHSTYSR